MKTKFIEISPFSEDFVKMQKFAESFDHIILPQRNAKLFAFERDDKTFGYADIFYLPVAFPAFHPEIVTPRGVVEVVQGFKAHCQFVTSGDGFIGVPLDETRSTFPRSMIEGQGFQKIEREIYAATGE